MESQAGSLKGDNFVKLDCIKYDGDIVISGVSCRLPESDNMEEFRQNLFKGKDMVTQTNRRWEPGYSGIPKRSGTLKDISGFDATYFGVHAKQADATDPQLRIMLEVTYEAIVDSGIHPNSLKGTDTGVFIGCGMSEALEAYSSDPDHSMSYTPLGCAASMLSNRLSYSFDLKGPSYCLRNGCGSGLLALDRGMAAIRTGQCESVIVGGCNLCLKPSISLQLNKMGLLSPEGICRCFDSEGDGYARSEGIVVFYLQKMTEAKRVYCSILNTTCISYVSSSCKSTCPSFEEQMSMLDFAYKEANVDPASLQYIEACSPCTKDGDVQEMEAVTKVLCNNRQDSLLIGCVKSNIGHTEPVSGLAGIAKVILAMQDGMIPGNLNYHSTNMDIPGLADGRLQVVTDRARFEGGIVGVSSFGLGGLAAHTILKSFDKVNLKPHPASACQRLFIYSGRTTEAVVSAIDVMMKHLEDVNLHELLNETCSSSNRHPFRGYTILNSKSNDRIQEIQKCENDQHPVWFVFSGMGTQWPGMGQDMMSLQVFHQSIMKSHNVLKDHGIDLYKLIMEGKDNSYDSVLHSFVALASIQVALVDVLTCMGIKPDGIVGHSVGELGCGYADGSLSAEETVLAAYHRGNCIQQANLPPGGMAAVGLTWEEAKQQCPEGVVAACHNAEKTVTISGPKESVAKFVQELKDKGVFARDVNSAGVAFHSYFMKNVAPALKTALKKSIVPKPRGSKWISTSIPESEWNTELAKYSSADYHVNNLTSPVLFQEGLKHIPDNAVVIEIAPHCLLQAVLKRSLPNTCSIAGLMKKGHEDNVNYFLSSLGKCYMYGVKVNPLGLYPPVEFPVPKSTPMISPAIKWDHSKTWNVPKLNQFLSGGTGRQTDSVFEVDMSPGSNYHHYNDHRIDGYALFPAAGYILLAWQALAKLRGELYEEMSLVLENLNIQRATILPKTGMLNFSVSIMQATGEFEITEGGSVVVSGCVRVPGGSLDLATDNEGIRTPVSKYGKCEINLKKADIYKELRLRGYDYGPAFQGIHASTDKGEEGNLIWKGDWVTFIDAMMQINLLTMTDRRLKLPTFIKSVCIDPKLHKTCVKPLDFDVNIIHTYVDTCTQTTQAGGIEIQDLEVTPTARVQKQKPPILEEVQFIPYEKTEKLPSDIKSYSKQCIGLVSKGLRQVIPEVEKLNLPHKDLIVSQAKNIPHEEMSQDIDQYLKKENCGLLQLFHKIFSLGVTGTNLNNILNIVDTYKQDLQSDQLLTYMLQAKCLKPTLDVVVENCTSTNLKVLEVDAVDGSMYQRVLGNLNLQPDLHIQYTAADGHADRISPDDMDSFGLHTLQWTPYQDLPVNEVDSYDLVVSNNVLHLQTNISKSLDNICKALKDGGFLLVHEVTQNCYLYSFLECLDKELPECEDISERSSGLYCTEEKWIDIFQKFGLDVVCQQSDGVLFTLFLLRKQVMNSISTPVILKINEADYSWLETLKTNISEIQKMPKGDNLWLVADENIYSGIVGLVNCLRNEPGAERIRCIFNAEIDGKSLLPNLDIYSKTFQKLSQKNLVMNVYRNGQFGSYRHIPICTDEETQKVLCKNATVAMEMKGNQSNFHWMMMPPEMSKFKDEENEELCHVFYTALNVEDLMVGTGKIMLPEGTNCFGSEFSGKTRTGRRIMGIAHNKALSTSVIAEKQYLLDIPIDWSLQDAATVIWAYSMAYFALCKKALINKKTSILIEDGASDVGLAAIAVAMDIGCEVFTTVSTAEKSMHIKACFPNLKDNHVLIDGENFFEPEILRATKGNGVDVVLNSEFTEDLHLNLRLLKPGGKYCDINRIGLTRKEITLGSEDMHSNINICTAQINYKKEEMDNLWNMLVDGIKRGVVKPLYSTTYPHNKIKQAIQDMSRQNHTGKILIQICNDEEDLHSAVPASPSISCCPTKSYILVGGLGGFGLELAEWLVEKGATKLILTSRSGIKTEYQSRKIQIWKNRNVDVTVSTHDATTEKGCRSLLEEAIKKGPVGGIFNLAAVLRDSMLENQTLETFTESCKPKVVGTVHLDKLTRELCKGSLDWFVMFSSVRSGRSVGAMGQTNYGYANSVMERICEKRVHDGLPGLAIQWGAVGDVGILMDKFGSDEVVVGGSLPQKITSCLQSLEKLLQVKTPVVSSFVLADKKVKTDRQKENSPSPAQAVLSSLGIDNIRSVNQDAKLIELGLDSLMVTEIKQVLEREFDIYLSISEIRQITFRKLKKMSNESSMIVEPEKETESHETVSLFPAQSVTLLNNATSDLTPVLIIVQPLEGLTESLSELAQQFDQSVFGLRISQDTPTDSIKTIAAHFLQQIEIVCPKGPYILIGCSFGAIVAMEMGLQLQHYYSDTEYGDKIKGLVLLDGSPDFVPEVFNGRLSKLVTMETRKQYGIIFESFVRSIIKSESSIKFPDNVNEKSFENYVYLVKEMITESGKNADDNIEDAAEMYHHFVTIATEYKQDQPYKREVTLVKAGASDIDCGIKEFCSGSVQIKQLKCEYPDLLKGSNLDSATDIIRDVLNKI